MTLDVSKYAAGLQYEAAFEEWLTDNKFTICAQTRNDWAWWPDFFVKSPSGSFYIVDVKSSPNHDHSWAVGEMAANSLITCSGVIVFMDRNTFEPRGAMRAYDIVNLLGPRSTPDRPGERFYVVDAGWLAPTRSLLV